MFRKKSLRKLAIFRIVLQNKDKKRAFWGKRQEKGDIQGGRPPCHGGGLRGKTGPYSGENDALEGRNKGRRTEKMGRDGRKQESLTTGKLFSPYYIYSAGKAKVAVASKSTPSCPLGGGQKPIAHPSGWSRDGFGTESRTRTSKFLMQARQQDHHTRIGSKVG